MLAFLVAVAALGQQCVIEQESGKSPDVVHCFAHFGAFGTGGGGGYGNPAACRFRLVRVNGGSVVQDSGVLADGVQKHFFTEVGAGCYVVQVDVTEYGSIKNRCLSERFEVLGPGEWSKGNLLDHLAGIKWGLAVIAKSLCYLWGYFMFRVFQQSTTKDAGWM